MFLELLLSSLIATATPGNDPCKVSPSVTKTPNATWCNTGLPPVRFQDKDSIVTVQFKRPLQVHWYCAGGHLIAGTIMACTEHSMLGTYVLTMPNPCEYANEPGEHYAVLLCHELGHVAGWPGFHGD